MTTEQMLREALADSQADVLRLTTQVAGMRRALNDAWRTIQWIRVRLIRHEPDTANAVRPTVERMHAALLCHPHRRPRPKGPDA